MDLLEDIAQEHQLFDRAAGSLLALTDEWIKNNDLETRKEAEKFCNFFEKVMIQFHTPKEEKLVFPFLEKLNIPRDKGPLFYYELEHKEQIKSIETIRSYTQKNVFTEDEKGELKKLAEKFCSEIWEHIDKEDSVLMSEVKERIRGSLLMDLNTEYQNYLAANQVDEGLTTEIGLLIKKYPPVEMLPDVFRGDGCMSCRHFGEGCQGIEHEWWTEHEWEDFFARNNRD
ncbi:MAG: hemerythrin domain-containing protein [Spirochaetia bacterium]|nr:hemerythrin domain-containing protein [Spirochaetia bacterium]